MKTISLKASNFYCINMKRIVFIVLNMIVCTVSAQQEQPPMQSPEIHADHSVTFRLKAPHAEKVQLMGDWMPARGWMPGTADMEKNEAGEWLYTTEALPSELYSYSFWVDGLRTTDPNNPFVIRDVATLSNIFIVDGERGDLYKINDVPHGTVSRRWYHSSALKMDRRITIYTPPAYETSAENYPVLYLLHGAGGDEEAWITLGRVAQIMDNLIAQNMARPMLVVMPNGNVIQDAAPGQGCDGFYTPQLMVEKTMDGTFEASFPEIMQFVESNYRAKTDKANRAIAGLSMGGFHALHISRYYPDTFDYVGLFSAAIMARNEVSEVYANMDATLKEQSNKGYKVYWMGIGKDDFLYKANEQYRQKLDSLGIEYTYKETEGGHVWKNWRVYLSEFVPLLFQE